MLREQAATPLRTTVTAADGSYSFTGLPVGAYNVVAAASIKGFDYTSDTDGAADWRVAVKVAPRKTSTADFAGLGRGTLLGQVFEEGSHKGIPKASIQCVWSGYDDVLGNADDVTLTVTADDNGSFDMSGVPYGYFSCDGRDEANNRVSAAVAAHVMSAEAVRTPLPLPSASSRAAIPAAAAATVVPSETPLPMTGSNSTGALRLALVLIMSGAAAALAGTRRRQRQ